MHAREGYPLLLVLLEKGQGLLHVSSAPPPYSLTQPGGQATAATTSTPWPLHFITSFTTSITTTAFVAFAAAAAAAAFATTAGVTAAGATQARQQYSSTAAAQQQHSSSTAPAPAPAPGSSARLRREWRAPP